MNLDIVIAHLRQRAASIFSNRVAGAASFEVLPESANLTMPAAYVIPLGEQPQEQTSQNGYQQTVREQFAVVVALSNRLNERGQSAATSLHGLRSALFRALLGFQPSAQHDAIAFEGGQLLHLDRARMYYQFEFSVGYAISTEDTWIPDRNSALPDFEGVDLEVDALEPFDRNRAPKGPDGTLEARLSINLPAGP